MRIPLELQAAIEQEIRTFEAKSLARASVELTRRYRSGEYSAAASDQAAQRAAYLLVRLPATYAAACRVFSEIRKLAPLVEVGSLLDLGSGPGTAIWAAADIFPDLRQTTLVECDRPWIEIGTRLTAHGSPDAIRQGQWIQQDLRVPCDWPRHDLVAISYSLGELPVSAGELLIQQALGSASKFLVVIEPGTTRGFGVIHRVRAQLIARNVPILAPCPHRLACPMAAAGDWCHFSQRVERTSTHRQLKKGELGYEDEKFSYIVAAKQGPEIDDVARIVRHPQKRSGYVQLELCTSRGIERRTVSRSQKREYKRARQADWGDLWLDSDAKRPGGN